MAWDTSIANQRTIISRIEGKLNTLRSLVNPITLYQTTTPTSTDLANAFNSTYPPAYSPALYERLQWVDPSTNLLRNQYQRLPDLNTTTFLTASTGVLRPLVTYPGNLAPYTRLGEVYVDDSGAASPLTLTLPQTFTHIKVYMQVRDSAAAVSATLTIRINGSASTTVYGGSYQSANSTFGLGTEQVGTSGFQFAVPAATAARTYYFQGMLTLWDYTTTYRMPRVWIQAASLWGNPYTTSTTTNYNYFGIFNTSGAVTSITFVSATGFGPGTRLVFFGI